MTSGVARVGEHNASLMALIDCAAHAETAFVFDGVAVCAIAEPFLVPLRVVSAAMLTI